MKEDDACCLQEVRWRGQDAGDEDIGCGGQGKMELVG